MAKRNKIDEETLVKLLAGRDEKALGILYDNYSAGIYGVILRIIQNDAIAEEVLHDSFVFIWKNILQYNPEKGRLFTWMISVCRKKAVEKAHAGEYSVKNISHGSEKFLNFDDSVNSLSYNPDTTGIKAKLSKLEPEYILIIDLLFFDGYSQSEAAEKLNIPLGTVKTRSRASIQKLINLFEND